MLAAMMLAAMMPGCMTVSHTGPAQLVLLQDAIIIAVDQGEMLALARFDLAECQLAIAIDVETLDHPACLAFGALAQDVVGQFLDGNLAIPVGIGRADALLEAGREFLEGDIAAPVRVDPLESRAAIAAARSFV